ncbi:MAG: hypothetical protein JST19_00180 [Bacteroidetes bacterium]|nr:hypothetical protein [Bacteroidota bacterium]
MNKPLQIILVLIATANLALPQQLSTKSKQVKSAYIQLKEHPDSKTYQLNYINIFPKDTTQFLSVFNPPGYGQLSDGFDYIEGFFRLAKYHPVAVISKAVDIGKDLKWDADAVNYLQHGIVELGNKFTRLFIQKVNSLSPKEQSNLITFLADVENHAAYPEYKQLIKAINDHGQKDLADQFTDAMQKREKQPHD